MSASPLVAELAGVRFRPCRFGDLARDVDHSLSSPVPLPVTIGYVNPHIVTTAVEHRTIAQHLNECDHVCVDGIGTWLALRLWRHGIERLPAYRAAERLLDRGDLRGPTAVIGIEPELIEQAAAGIMARNADVKIVAVADGFRTDEEIESMLETSNARVVLIGAGSPRSEQMALVARRACPKAIVFHVGAGTLKTWAGVRSHAPHILSTLGVDWIYRFVKEPHTRSRYRRGIPAFVCAVARGSHSVISQSAPVTTGRIEGVHP